jgi:hypothetical protein
MRDERQSERSAQPAVAAGRDFSAFWLTTKQQHTHASNAISCSMLEADSNGAAFMRR